MYILFIVFNIHMLFQNNKIDEFLLAFSWIETIRKSVENNFALNGCVTHTVCE